MPISPAILNGYEFGSEAEKKVYMAAAGSKYFNNQERYLFHSLDMAETGNLKLKAEIDFVYMDNDCLLFFEVKGGQVKYDPLRNDWYVMGATKKGNPFKQAYDALFYTRDVLLPKLFNSKSVSDRLVFGIGVLFPECLRPQEFQRTISGAMEFDPRLIYDFNDHSQIGGLVTFIKQTKAWWSSHPQFRSRAGISHREMVTISKFFRQELCFRLPVSDILSREKCEMSRLTGMQKYVLDNLDYNPGKGGIIMGGPGTGKTLLALELLKRSVQLSKKTLLVFYNKYLAKHLVVQAAEGGIVGNYQIGNLHGLLRDDTLTGGLTSPTRHDEQYWFRDLPLAFSRGLSSSERGSYDYIIIDEGQDILNEYQMEALGALLKGGFESGNWTLFLDKKYQNIYNGDAEEYFEYFRNAYPCIVTGLALNCRNTPSTIKRAVIQTGLPMMACMRSTQVWNSEVRYYNPGQDYINQLLSGIFKLENEGVRREHITVLCIENEQIRSLTNANKCLFHESAFPVAGKVNICTIHSYKGLENCFILIAGPSDYDPHNQRQMSLIFIANTRATAQSIFFLDRRFKTIIEDREDSNL